MPIVIGNCILVGGGGDTASVPSVPEFRFSVNSAGTGTSAANQFTIPINDGTFNYDISTDDGYSATGVTGAHTITFPSGKGVHNVVITGTFPGMKFSNGGDKLKILTIDNFGIYGVGSTSQRFAFQGCSNLVVNATDTGDFSQVSNFQRFCLGTNVSTFPLIDFSSATNLADLFSGATSLTTFPANAFDNTAGNQYSNAFTNTNLTTQSIDNILVSIDTSGADGAFNTFKQSGGQAPSATGIAAKDSLVAKGWTVIYTV